MPQCTQNQVKFFYYGTKDLYTYDNKRAMLQKYSNKPLRYCYLRKSQQNLREARTDPARDMD